MKGRKERFEDEQGGVLHSCPKCHIPLLLGVSEHLVRGIRLVFFLAAC